MARAIIESFEARGLPVHELVAAAGLPEKNRMLLQIYADVTGRDFKIAGSPQALLWVMPCTQSCIGGLSRHHRSSGQDGAPER